MRRILNRYLLAKRVLVMASRIFVVGFLLLVVFPTTAQEVAFKATPLNQSQCSGHFVSHLLSHITTVNQMPIRMFDSNGSGLALGDLNNDGLIDIVLANLDAPETILWNEGHLQFQHQELNIPGRTRAVIILDLDSDGWRDIIFTSQRGAPSLWLNQHNGEFDYRALTGVSHPAYAMNWGDMDGDGDLDLVTGSYDAELSMIMTNNFLFSGGAGIYYYENQDDSFVERRLADTAQTLTILFSDVTGDSRWDIVAGNDFAEVDRYWTWQNDDWLEVMPFHTITHSTMSFDSADLDNDGSWELFATDMHPYNTDEATRMAWKPVMEDMMAMPMLAGDPQVMTNTLQSTQAGEYRNISDILGIDASGWSWSAKFGDLDSDGFNDLYIVNGMIAEDLFGHLPKNELVEENMVFSNLGGNVFTPASDWGLNSAASGRGMSMADMDGDGDLDIVVNNLMLPSTLFENQLCGGSNLIVSLYQPDTDNPDAIGARLVLRTSADTYQREIRAASGYLSGDAAQAHFGFPDNTQLESLKIIWPDGQVSQITDLARNTHLQVKRN